jgi:hypothetical protein
MPPLTWSAVISNVAYSNSDAEAAASAMSVVTSEFVYLAVSDPELAISNGTWSGSATSAGWDLNYSGSVGSGVTSIHSTGTVSTATTVWASSGNVGTNTVSESGESTASSYTQKVNINSAAGILLWFAMGAIDPTPFGVCTTICALLIDAGGGAAIVDATGMSNWGPVPGGELTVINTLWSTSLPGGGSPFQYTGTGTLTGGGGVSYSGFGGSPEPGSFALCIIGLVCFVGARPIRRMIAQRLVPSSPPYPTPE